VGRVLGGSQTRVSGAPAEAAARMRRTIVALLGDSAAGRPRAWTHGGSPRRGARRRIELLQDPIEAALTLAATPSELAEAPRLLRSESLPDDDRDVEA
jgi:hypothetical protein